MHAKARELADDIKESDLDTDWIRTYALVRALEVIGEAAGHVPTEEQKQHTDISWGQIVGLRNRLIHGYGSMNVTFTERHARVGGGGVGVEEALFGFACLYVMKNGTLANHM